MSNELNFLAEQARQGRISRRDFLGRAMALGMALPFASSVFAEAVGGTPRKGGILKAGMQGGSSTDSLDPASWTSQVQFMFGKSWGECLTNVAPNGDLVPRLAEAISSSSDARTWTFKLRQGVMFHNGQEMTAADVVATLERHSDEASESGALGIMRGLESIRANGKYELVITTTTPNADLPYLFSDYHLMIQPNGGKDAPDAGIGTGPYKVTEFEPGVRQSAERFEGYWNLDEWGHAAEIEVTVINDPTARMAALQSGQVHMVNRVEPRVVDMVKRLSNVQVRNVSGPAHYCFPMHCDTAPFSDKDLRMALKLAMNREDMVDRILRGYGSVGNDYPINGAYPLAPTDIPQREFDPDQARFLYERSGHSGPIVLRTSDVAFPGAVDAAQLYQQTCAQAGINLEVVRSPGDGYWSDVWNKEPFCASYWSGRPTQDQMYSTGYVSGADWNDTHFYNEQFDQLAVQARGELDQGKRAQMYHDMAMILRDEGGLLLPMFNDYIEAHNNQVQGWVDHPQFEMMSGFALSRCWLSA